MRTTRAPGTKASQLGAPSAAARAPLHARRARRAGRKGDRAREGEERRGAVFITSERASDGERRRSCGGAVAVRGVQQRQVVGPTVGQEKRNKKCLVLSFVPRAPRQETVATRPAHGPRQETEATRPAGDGGHAPGTRRELTAVDAFHS